MNRRIDRGKDRPRTAEFHVPSRLFNSRVFSIKLIVKSWIADVNLIRGNSNDRTWEDLFSNQPTCDLKKKLQKGGEYHICHAAYQYETNTAR